jgi:hypothetical protein
MVADDDSGRRQRHATDCNGEGRERAVSDGGDTRVMMMAAASEHGGSGQRWWQWAMKAMVDDDSGRR